ADVGVVIQDAGEQVAPGSLVGVVQGAELLEPVNRLVVLGAQRYQVVPLLGLRQGPHPRRDVGDVLVVPQQGFFGGAQGCRPVVQTFDEAVWNCGSTAVYQASARSPSCFSAAASLA